VRGPCAGLLLSLLAVGPAPASAADEAGLAPRMERLTTHYHEDPARLDAARAELEAAVAAQPSVALLVMLAQISYLWGDVRGSTGDAKIQAYERGRQAADLALQRDPGSADARFWRAANLGRWLERNRLVAATKIGSLRDEVQAIIRDHPDYVGAYSFLGNYYYRAPWPWGSLDEATRMFRQGLARDPRATGMRVGLARTLIDKRMPNEARAELQRVLDEKAPANLAEWTLRDAPDARKLLESLPARP
jgi:tetratricopeptide (TPR) repeat protein